jgi:hypothetical protein
VVASAREARYGSAREPGTTPNHTAAAQKAGRAKSSGHRDIGVDGGPCELEVKPSLPRRLAQLRGTRSGRAASIVRRRTRTALNPTPVRPTARRVKGSKLPRAVADKREPSVSAVPAASAAPASSAVPALLEAGSAGSLATRRLSTSTVECPPKSAAATSPRYSATALADTMVSDDTTSTAESPVTSSLPALVRGSGLGTSRGRSSGGPCERRSLNRKTHQDGDDRSPPLVCGRDVV